MTKSQHIRRNVKENFTINKKWQTTTHFISNRSKIAQTMRRSEGKVIKSQFKSLSKGFICSDIKRQIEYDDIMTVVGIQSEKHVG